MFAIFCLAMAVFVWVFVPETKQLTLEEIDVIFGVVDAETRAKDIEKAIEVEKSATRRLLPRPRVCRRY